MSRNRFTEVLHAGYGQGFELGETLFHRKTEFQEIAIYETPALGRVLVLDNIVQTTEADEFYYHEMITHMPIFAHGAAKRVLIIGGGDGGALREVLKHPGIEKAVMVEIDESVVDLCKQHLPRLSDGAFDDPRAELIFADGTKFMAETDQTFDIAIVDSTDPIGPAVTLFEDPFYKDCRRALGENGILVRQAGVPFFQRDEYVTTYRKLMAVFKGATFASVAVPTYCGGAMALAWGTDNPEHFDRAVEDIRHRFGQAGPGFSTRYYTPDIHRAAFALPAFMRKELDLAS